MFYIWVRILNSCVIINLFASDSLNVFMDVASRPFVLKKIVLSFYVLLSLSWDTLYINITETKFWLGKMTVTSFAPTSWARIIDFIYLTEQITETRFRYLGIRLTDKLIFTTFNRVVDFSAHKITKMSPKWACASQMSVVCIWNTIYELRVVRNRCIFEMTQTHACYSLFMSIIYVYHASLLSWKTVNDLISVHVVCSYSRVTADHVLQ